MTISSMTGFAREAGTTGAFRWAWELKTVNARGLDIRVRVPGGYEAVGEEARQALSRALQRGTCHVSLTVSMAEGAARVRINHEAAQAVLDAVAVLDVPDGVRPLSMDAVLAVRGVVETVEADEAALDQVGAELAAGLQRAVAALVANRRSEGRALGALLDAQLAAIGGLADAADACPARKPEAIRARLADQVAALLDTGATLDPARLHQEAVLLAAKADVREEIDRLRAHVEAARGLLAGGGAVGRRLDFLAQEFGRESNTLCAKANDVTLSAIGLDLKTVVEQFREQTQNVE